MKTLIIIAAFTQWDMAPPEPSPIVTWDQSPAIAANFNMGPTVPEPTAEPKPAVCPHCQRAASDSPAKAAYAQCCCQGRNTGLCFCLQNRVKCGCTQSTGSLWHLDGSGRADRKIASGEPLVIPPKPVAKPQPKPAPVQTPKQAWVPGTKFQWLTDGQWRDEPQPGVDYPSVGVYGSRQVAQVETKPASGRWVTRKVCHGSYCTFERVWVEG